MTTFATDSCHNLFQFVDTVYLHGFSGGTRRDTGCFFLLLFLLHSLLFVIFATRKLTFNRKYNEEKDKT